MQAGRASFGASKMPQCTVDIKSYSKTKRSGSQGFWRLRRRWDGNKRKPEGLGRKPMTMTMGIPALYHVVA
jgi:hypothetical protein